MKTYLKKIIALFILTIVKFSICNAQSEFNNRLDFYYKSNNKIIDSVMHKIANDTILSNNGNFGDFVKYIQKENRLYKDSLLNILIMEQLQYNDRFLENLTNKDKNELLTFFCQMLLDSCNSKYYQTISTLLFNVEFWNDSMQYSSTLQSLLEEIIIAKPKELPFAFVRLLTIAHLEYLFADVIKYVIKPTLEKGTPISEEIWGHIYFLSHYKNEEVLPYLYRAIAQSGCDINYPDTKYSHINGLLYELNTSVKKNILLNIFKDDCYFKLTVPSLRRTDVVRSTYFDNLVNSFLAQYKNFPLEQVSKLTGKNKKEYTKSWIEKNL